MVTHPANRIANVMRRADRARSLGVTCPASRLVDLLARTILRRGEDVGTFSAEEAAGSMLSVVENLWKQRAKAAKRK